MPSARCLSKVRHPPPLISWFYLFSKGLIKGLWWTARKIQLVCLSDKVIVSVLDHQLCISKPARKTCRWSPSCISKPSWSVKRKAAEKPALIEVSTIIINPQWRLSVPAITSGRVGVGRRRHPWTLIKLHGPMARSEFGPKRKVPAQKAWGQSYAQHPASATHLGKKVLSPASSSSLAKDPHTTLPDLTWQFTSLEQTI